MSKLVYPKDGIYNYCKSNLDSTTSSLSRAISNCNLDVPYGFVYKRYLNQLYDNLYKYYREINAINSKIKQIDNNYNALESDLVNEANKLVSEKIKKRDRMII